MRKLLIGLLILGGVIAAIAVMRRRSSSGVDEWDSFAPVTRTRRRRAPVAKTTPSHRAGWTPPRRPPIP